MKMDPATGQNRALFERFHIDLPLLLGVLALMGFGLVVMYSASGQSLAMMDRQAMRMAMALIIMVILAQIPPRTYESAALSYFLRRHIVGVCTAVWGNLQRRATLARSRFCPFSAFRTAQTRRTFDGGTLHRQTRPATVVQNLIRLVGNGVRSNHFNCETARPWHLNFDCSLRHFCNLLGGH